MSDIILKAVNISKQYRLGLVGTGTLSHDLNRFWHAIRGKEDPYLKVGAVNDRSAKASSSYVWALQDINFEVKRGEILGIIGKNGAGKSTLLKILSRVTSPTTGNIKSKGRIASLLEVGTGMHPELTGKENIYLNGAILGMTKGEIASKIDEIIEFSGCQMYINTPVKRYSSGMRVRLGFAVAAFLEPDILVVDEVLAVGDAEFQQKAIGKMQDISNTTGRTVLFVSHNMAAVRKLCTRGIVLENGKNVFNGSADEAVNFYLHQVDQTVVKRAFVNQSHRRSSTGKDVVLKEICVLNNIITTRDKINFEITFVNNIVDLNRACVSGTICKNSGEPIGSFFVNINSIVAGENSIRFSIENHNLSAGLYEMNFSFNKGFFGQRLPVSLDHAYGILRFPIENESINEGTVLQWNASWGVNYYKTELIK